MIKKIVIPAAGFGTRLLPATKETPKEMLPIFAKGNNGNVIVKPLLQVIFEQFFGYGIREYCFIVGKGKGSISDHFTSDAQFLRSLREGGKEELARELIDFYTKINSSSIVFINQPEAKGFGDAVLRAKPYVNESFFTHAGDTLLLSKDNNHIKRLEKVMKKNESHAIFLVKEVVNPSSFGIIRGQEIENEIYLVNEVVEKPSAPISNLAIVPLYLFSVNIFDALESISTGVGGEIQLTDGIQKMIESGQKVMALKMRDDELWLDLGNPISYWDALQRSHSDSNNI